MTQRPLPPYTYVPGRTPHPVSSPEGHMRGHAPLDVGDPARWWNGEAFRTGLTLFNHGYYWEAHEAWEAVWKALPRNGTDSLFVKGLIKLAAGGVKCMEGNVAGAQRHFRRSVELINAGARTGAPFDIDELRALISAATVKPPTPVERP